MLYIAKITGWYRNYLVLVYIRFLGVKYDVILVLRNQFFEYLRQTLYRHALEHLEAARSENIYIYVYIFSSYGKRLTSIDLLEGLRLVGTHFRH